jgi:hypothetical protein
MVVILRVFPGPYDVYLLHEIFLSEITKQRASWTIGSEGRKSESPFQLIEVFSCLPKLNARTRSGFTKLKEKKSGFPVDLKLRRLTHSRTANSLQR